MAKKLGRGLSHLLPTADNKTPSAEIAKHPEYQELPIEQIKRNPKQPRKRFNEKEIEELSRTLHTVGLIEPIIVRKVNDDFQLISGERRWRACKLAGFKKIPAIVKNLNDVQALEMGIIENIQREALNPIEEARAYDALMEMTGAKASDLADKVGKDRTTITNLLRLLKLPEEVLELVERKQITAGQARPLLGIGDRRLLLTLARKIVTQGWSARRVEDEVARLTDLGGTKKEAAPRSAKSDPNIKTLEDKIRRQYSAKVNIDHKKNGGGRISLHYGNLDDLDRLLDLLGVKKG